ncbi:DUF707 domain-containing protein [Acidiphilium sp.]|uniref:DUF707 domain-containing protein n=1 Tax=Acidiphilium sp. TaxID=527 RepID=UPI003D01AB55
MPQNAPILEPALLGSLWVFGMADGTPIAETIGFGPGGRILGHFHKNETAWRIENDVLEFLNADRHVTARFAPPEGEDEVTSLHGMATSPLWDEARPVMLLRIGATLPASPAAPRRRNLVIMRAGSKALFPQWATAATREWDFALSWYGTEDPPDWGQDFLSCDTGPKFQPIGRWLDRHRDLVGSYDHIWLPDDDIMTDWTTVDRLFSICREFDLQLAQPALTHQSFSVHRMLFECPEYRLRYTNFVEGMVPVFSAAAAMLCLPVFLEATTYGWGHDWIFPRLLGYPKHRIAVIDACAVTHTRPCGINTNLAQARAELKAITAKYGANYMDHRIHGCIFQNAVPWL